MSVFGVRRRRRGEDKEGEDRKKKWNS